MVKLEVTFDAGDVMERLAQAKQNTLEQLDGEVLLNYFATTATFNDPVTFRVEKHEDYHAVGTDDKIYQELNDGFIREVALSEDYQRKTVPHVLASFPGQGRVIGDLIFGVQVEPGQWNWANADEVQPMAGPIAHQEYGKLLTGK